MIERSAAYCFDATSSEDMLPELLGDAPDDLDNFASSNFRACTSCSHPKASHSSETQTEVPNPIPF